jgi:hypothetical protein
MRKSLIKIMPILFTLVLSSSTKAREVAVRDPDVIVRDPIVVFDGERKINVSRRLYRGHDNDGKEAWFEDDLSFSRPMLFPNGEYNWYCSEEPKPPQSYFQRFTSRIWQLGRNFVSLITESFQGFIKDKKEGEYYLGKEKPFMKIFG